MSFEKFQLSKPLRKAIADLGFTEATEIQVKAIPVLTTYKGDFVGQAQTGTGKTAAFVLPLLEQIDLSAKNVQALILAPTRELANQVHQEVEKLSKYLSVRSTTVYGGVSYTRQINALKKDFPHIVVGTPGRIIDLIERGVLQLNRCTHLVIDEADEMLNMGFIDDVLTIIDSLDQNKKMWMFSATMPKPIVKMIEKKFSKPKIERVEKTTLGNADISQFYFAVKRRHFAEALMRYITAVECFGIIFCETREETKNLAELMLSRGVSAVSLHGELNQSQRDAAMKKFKDKKADFLICTDVAARGIDVNNVTHVFNIGLPRQNESYVHRIGRTGRAGTKGIAISFIAPEGYRKLKQVEALSGQKIRPLQMPKPADMKKIKIYKELVKMDGLKGALVDEDVTFKIDPSFKYFKSYFEGLSKDQILKLLFSYRFNREIRQIDDSGHLEMVERVIPRGRSERNSERNSERRSERRKKGGKNAKSTRRGGRRSDLKSRRSKSGGKGNVRAQAHH